MTRALFLLALLPAALSSGELGPLVSRPALYRVQLTGTRGAASYYHRQLEGRQMADLTRYRAEGMTAAHRTLPLGRKVQVCRQDRPRCCVSVVIADRFGRHDPSDRVLDLSGSAARKLGMIRAGIVPVTVMEVTKDG